jgi:hypothetical protein
MRTWPLLLLTAATALAQAHISAPEPTGAVTGHVFCADTNQPARFAKVSLEAIPDPSATPSKDSQKPGSVINLGTPGGATVETTLDGSFILTKVKPGAYYVIVEKPGYVKPRDIFTKKQMEDPSPEMRTLIAGALPRVVVEPNQTETTEVRIDRGAAISGTILYDDGSPAADLEVKLLHKDATGKWVPLNGNELNGTDDRGYFRIPSLIGDEYIIEADLSLSGTKTYFSTANSQGQTMKFDMMNVVFTLPFYGSGTPRQSQATSVKLLPGQELTGQDMALPISKLHKLTGRVAAGTNAHLVNAANVALVTRDDNKEIATSEISRDDGLFHFEFVPEGDYILRVTNARDVVWETPTPDPNAATPMMVLLPSQDKEHVTASYGNVDQPLIFSGEMLDVIATVPPTTASQN